MNGRLSVRVMSLMVGTMAVLGCRRSEAPKLTAGELAALQIQVGFTFPAGTELLGLKRENGMDDMVKFKIAVPRAAWPALEAALPVKPADMVAGAGTLGPDRGWWDPEAAPNVRSGHKSLPDARSIRIAVDDSHPHKVILYVREHGT